MYTNSSTAKRKLGSFVQRYSFIFWALGSREVPHKILAPIGFAVLTLIGYEHTDKLLYIEENWLNIVLIVHLLLTSLTVDQGSIL